ISSLTIGGATVSLVPQVGGLKLDVELDQLKVGMHLKYAAACINGSHDIMIGASHVSVAGTLAMGILNSNFDIHLDNPKVKITGFDVDLGGIPGAVVDMLSLDTALGPILGWATGKFVVPLMNKKMSNYAKGK